VLEDACCALSAQEHEEAMRGLQRFCRVASTHDVVFE
jgi:nicotinamidase-related amidase